MCDVDSGTLLFDSDIDKTKRVVRKSIWEAREAATNPLSDLSDFSSDDDVGDMEHITLLWKTR